MPIEQIHRMHARAQAAEELLQEALPAVEADAPHRRDGRASLPERIAVHLAKAEHDDRTNPPSTSTRVRF